MNATMARSPQQKRHFRSGALVLRGDRESLVHARVRGIEIAVRDLTRGDVVENLDFQRCAVQLPCDIESMAEFRRGVGIMSHALERIGEIVVRGKIERWVAFISLRRLLVILKHVRIVARILIERTDLLQSDRLAARLVGFAEDFISVLEISERRLHGTPRPGKFTVHEREITGELGAGREPQSIRQHGIDERERLCCLTGPEQSFGLKPRACDFRDALFGARGQIANLRQGCLRIVERRLRIAHHRRLGVGDILFVSVPAIFRARTRGMGKRRRQQGNRKNRERSPNPSHNAAHLIGHEGTISSVKSS